MRKKTRFLMLLLLCLATPKAWSDAADASIYRQALFNMGDEGSQYWRIPALTVANDGSLIAVADARGTSLGDLPNTITLMSRRSTDNGVTWSDPVVVAQGNSSTGKTYGDAALITERETGKIICMYVGDKGLWTATPEDRQGVYYSESTDNGQSWSDPISITDQVYANHSSWYACFAGSGHGLQLESGRLIYILAVRPTSLNYGPLQNWTLYSDDKGATWSISDNYATASGDEAKAIELEDGTVLMSIRNPNKGYRRFCKSTDKGKSWGNSYLSETLIDCACNGDIISCEYNGQKYLVHSLPKSSTTRENVSFFVSADEGETWTFAKQLVDGYSAYSSMVELPDGTIGVLVEEGKWDSSLPGDDGFTLVYYNFTKDWLFEDVNFGGEAPTGTLVCNGNDRYMSIPDHDDFDMPAIASNQYTVTLRVKKSSATTVSERFMSKRASGGNGWELWGVTSSYNFAVNTTPSYSLPGASHNSFVYGDEWNHLSWVFDGPNKKSYYYINGNKAAETTITNNSTSTTSLENDLDLLVGCGYSFSSTSISFPFEGEIDDVHFYKSALSADQVATDMNSFDVTTAQTLSLVAAYDFAGISGTSVPDISGNGHTGTLHGYSVADKYQTPSGSIHSEKTTYVEHIYSEGASINVNKSWESAPNEVYQLVEEGIEVERGATFNLHLDAYSLGEESSTTVYQDLRYTLAVVFSDWDSDGTFTQEQVYGNNPPTNVTTGNMDVMEINQPFTVPADAALGECRIRVIYNNAWKDIPTANSVAIYEGMAYDIVVNVVEAASTETFAVTFGQAENGTFTINNGETAINSGDEILSGTTLTVVPTPANGYELDAITVNGSKIAGTTFLVRNATEVIVTFKEVDNYCYPTFTRGGQEYSDIYLTAITTVGAFDGEEVSYTATSRPNSDPDNYYDTDRGYNYYYQLPETLTVTPGQTFTLSWTASRGTTNGKMTQCLGEVFADWNGDGAFDGTFDTAGVTKGTTLDLTGTDEYLYVFGTYMTTVTTYLDLDNYTITVPADATLGKTRIRIRIMDAWEVTWGPCDQVRKGIVYDIPVEIVTDEPEVTTVTVTVVNEGKATLNAVNEETGDPIVWDAVAVGTVVNLSVTAPEGKEVASVTFNGTDAYYNEGTYDFIVDAAGELVIKLTDKETAIDELEGDNNQLYYANGKIYTHVEGEIFVYDLSGKLVRRAQSAPVAVDDLANGVYIVKANGGIMRFVK